MKKLALNTGAYINEGDCLDPGWKADFYGKGNYERMLEVKNRYDPEGKVSCPICVESDAWEVDGEESLCRVW